MPENERIVLQEIREDIVFIKTTLTNITTNLDLKLVNLEEKIKVANHRIDDLEDQNKWLWRSVVGTVIAGVIALILK